MTNPAMTTVNPASGPAGQALFLSLHGASVEAIGQADAYSPKKWGPIVCPTNRRPYGFDWEEWGRWDALEVLALQKQSGLRIPLIVIADPTMEAQAADCLAASRLVAGQPG